MKKILGFLLVVVLLFVGFVATRPAKYHIVRNGSIAASPQTVYDQINDFHQWAAWSPWEQIDPQMKKTFGGPESGVGATYAWSGNDKVGEGRMTITESRPAEKVSIRLEFIKPFKATDQATFVLRPEGSGTKVFWAMDGTNNFMGKAMSLFMNMDKMVGGDFEKGLASLKTISEAEVATTTDSASAGSQPAAAPATTGR
jgi:hypothetical protein